MNIRRTLDVAAATSAAWIMAWANRRFDVAHREWIEAMAAEMAEIDSGWERLRWALGGVRLALGSPRRVMVGVPVGPAAADALDEYSQNPVSAFAYGVLGFAVWFLLLSATFRLIVPAAAGWEVRDLFMIAACGLGAIGASSLRINALAPVLTGFFAFSATEFAIHSTVGIAVVQGGPAHFAVMSAGILGAAAFRKLYRAWYRMPSVIGAALVAFVASEAGIHAIYGADPFRDAATHGAIGIAAVTGAAVTAWLIRPRRP